MRKQYRDSGSKELVFQAVARLFLLVGLVLTSGAAQAQESAPYVENQVIVKFKIGVRANEVVSLKDDLGPSIRSRLKIVGAELWTLSASTVEEAISRYSGDPRIEYIEPNYRVHAIATVPNDPNVSQLWGLNNMGQTGGLIDADIDGPEAWNIQTGGDVLVGVVDTGVDWTHEDLADNIWVNPGEIPDNGTDDDGNGYIDDVRGWDFLNGDNDPMDDNGHGTHVSGTIAAVGNNGIGVVGVCWSARIMPLKFLGSSGQGSVADAVLAIEYATMMGAKLTNNSWGGGEFSQALYDAIAAAGDAGILFIAAAGNLGTNNDLVDQFPSDFDLDNIIAVAATTARDTRATFSNFGFLSVDLGAPGASIYSTLPENGYGSLSGTSMATPHVSGVAALIWSQNPDLSATDVKTRILSSVDPIPDLEGITVTGGRLNAHNALADPDSIPPDPVTDLAAAGATSNSVTLTWTATGDDHSTGRASSYDIRYSAQPIDDGNFDAATEATGGPRPQPSGSTESFTVTGLEFQTTYYFALKVFDEWGNGSAVSNSVSETTLGAPDIAVTPAALSLTLAPGDSASQSVTVSNVGQGTLSFEISVQRGEMGTSPSRVIASELIAADNRESNRTGTTKGRANRTDRKRDAGWVREILQANAAIGPVARAAMGAAMDIGRSHSPAAFDPTEILSWQENRFSAGADPIYAVVLDGIGTFSAADLLWDQLNANWSRYGAQSLVIDYSTFHAVEITYDRLAATGADVLIISDNWNPTQPYGPFSDTEARAIARYVEEGAGLYISAGTFNNGEFPELQLQVEMLAPLVGLDPTGRYYWNGNTYGPLSFLAPGHPLLRSLPEPYASGWQNKTLVPGSGTWATASVPSGTLVALSENGQTGLVVRKNRIFHSGLPEHISGTETDLQFLYNAITWSAARASWLSVDPLQGSVVSGSGVDLTIGFNATDLESGLYNAELVVASNDPDENPLILPVELQVGGGGDPTAPNLTWKDSESARPSGSLDTLHISVSDMTGLQVISYQLEVTFEDSVLAALGAVSAGTISERFGPPTVNTSVKGEMTVGGFGTQPLSGSGALVGLVFNVVGDAGAVTHVCLKSVILNSGEPAANIVDSCARFVVSDPGAHQIGGRVNYAISGAPADGVTMTLSGDATQSQTTDANGDYLFSGLQPGLDYSVTPSADVGNSRDFISCFDGALAAQHAVGRITLTPDQQEAADVDEDGFVFTFDAALICRYAVGMPPFGEKDQTGHWRFDPRSRAYTQLASDQPNQDYAATLLGDVDGNWTSSSLGKSILSHRGDAFLQDMVARPGEVVTLPLMFRDRGPVHSVDIDLEYDPEVLRFVGVSKTELSKTFEVLTNPQAGRLRIGAFSAQSVDQTGDFLLLRFEVVGKAGARSHLRLRRLQIDGGPTKKAEAELKVRSSTAEIPKKYRLGQNYPNPFNPMTTIRFDVPAVGETPAKIRLFIHEVRGQLVRVLVNEDRPPGSYEIRWDGRNESGKPMPSGVYFYTMVAGDFKKTKRMLLLK